MWRQGAGLVADWAGHWPETLNTLMLTEEHGEMPMTQTVLYPSKDARDKAPLAGMKGGVTMGFDRLDDDLRAPV